MMFSDCFVQLTMRPKTWLDLARNLLCSLCPPKQAAHLGRGPVKRDAAEQPKIMIMKGEQRQTKMFNTVLEFACQTISNLMSLPHTVRTNKSAKLSLSGLNILDGVIHRAPIVFYIEVCALL